METEHNGSIPTTQAAVPSPWLTVAEAAEYARCGTRLIYNAIGRRGELRAARIGAGRNVRVKVEWLNEWLSRCAEPKEIKAR